MVWLRANALAAENGASGSVSLSSNSLPVCSAAASFSRAQACSAETAGTLEGTRFFPQGKDVREMLSACHETVLLAATLGADSERMLLRAQTKSAADALILDAVLSAAIEEVCDRMEETLREKLAAQALYLTDRFSPGYGDMPLAQSGQICEVLNAGRSIGLTVSQSGILMPRKSVTAVLGISRTQVLRRPKGCEGCSERQTCAFARREDITEE